ncbi:toll/interleukin-1 receptor domain-containing protein [Thermodesulfobacteriota bacterium]
MQRVFLSHSSKDKRFVREFDSVLHGLGVSTFLDERDIKLGEDIPQRIYNELSEASHVLYFISSHSVCSKWVQEELSVAKMREKEREGILILPILIEELSNLPASIVSKRYADFTDGSINIEDPAFGLVLDALGVATSETISVNVTATKKLKEMVSSVLLVSAELETKLSDISFMLRFAAETPLSGISIRRLSETKSEIHYRQVDISLTRLMEDLRGLKGMTMLRPHLTDLRKRIEAFLEALQEVYNYQGERRPDAQWLNRCAETARYLQVGIGHIHELLLVFYLKTLP